MTIKLRNGIQWPESALKPQLSLIRLEKLKRIEQVPWENIHLHKCLEDLLFQAQEI